MPQGPPDLSGTAARFATPVVRRRYGVPTLTAERLLQDSPPTDTAGRAHHWPASGETLERLPEGTEAENVREGTTSMVLRGPEEAEALGTRADSILVGSAEYQVVEWSPRFVNAAGVVTWYSFVMVRIPTR